VGLFRRSEPLHERLAREGGLTPPDPRPQWQETGIHGIARHREWDVTTTADAPDVRADAATFVVLPDRTLLVEDGPDDVSLDPLASAVEEALAPPYRARAVRQSDTLWAVQARQIEVVAIPNGPDGDAIELAGGELRVDEERAFGSVPELEGLGDVVRAERLDGDLWEVRAERL
jgi:hypothetical protein